MNPCRIVLTGATGFIGGAVLRELARVRSAEPGSAVPQVRLLGRRQPANGRDGYDTWHAVDLADPDSLAGACGETDVLLHLATAVGQDADLCTAVNDRGTAALMAEARHAGVRGIVQLSTAAVYGRGPHQGIDVDDVDPAPRSPASRSRLAGERHARAAGAWVLRPGLVVGRGDRWVVPALAELVRRVPGRWDGGGARLSLVAVDDLARLIVRLAVRPALGTPGVFHASHPVPVRNTDLLAALAAHQVLPAVPDEPVVWEDCLQRLRDTTGGVGESQFALLARDHWYESTRIWRLADCPPGPGPLAALDQAAGWYRDLLRDPPGP